MSSYSWTCPHCQRPTTVTANDFETAFLDINLKNAEGPLKFSLEAIRCPNSNCARVAVSLKENGMVRFWTLQSELAR